MLDSKHEALPDFDERPEAKARVLEETVRQKLIDVLTPGFTAVFTPDEAELAGAFVEDAMSEDDVLAAPLELPDARSREGQ